MALSHGSSEQRRWRFRSEGAVLGPFDDDELAEQIVVGRLVAATALSPEGLEEWSPAASWRPDLFAGTAATLVPQPSIAPAAQERAPNPSPEPSDNDSPLNSTAQDQSPEIGEGESRQPIRFGNGPDAYRNFQLRLAGEISIAEAEEARVAFERGQRILGWSLGAAALVTVCLTYLGNHQSSLGSVARNVDGFLTSALVVLAMLLVQAGSIPIAGRMIYVICWTIGIIAEPLLGHPERLIALGAGMPIVAALCFGLGWLLDLGLSALSTDATSRLGRVLIGLSSLMSLGLVWVLSLEPEAQNEDNLASFGGALTLFALTLSWHRWPGPWLIARFRPTLSPDAEGLVTAAWRRWSWRLCGRALAIGIASFPFVLFLNGLGVDERWSKPTEANVILTGSPPATTKWLFTPTAHFLTSSTLASEEIYGECPAQQTIEQVNTLEGAFEQAAQAFGKDTVEVAAVRRLLWPGRLATDTSFRAFVEGCKEPVFYWIGNSPVRADRGHEKQWLVSWVARDDLIQPLEVGVMEDQTKQLDFVRGLLITLGVVAFLLLWARGGDSPLARWLGLWLVGIGCLVMAPFYAYFLDAFVYSAWRSTLISPFAGALVLLTLMGKAISAVLVVLIPAATVMVFRIACWPTGTRTRSLGRRALAVMGLSLVLIAVTIGSWLALGTVIDPTNEARALATIAGLALLPFCTAAAGAWVRQRTSRHTEAPDLGGPGLLFWVLVFINLAFAAYLRVFPIPYWLPIVGTVLTALLALSALWLIVPRNVLNIAGGRNLSYLVLVVLLPFLFETAEGLVEWVLADSSLSSKQGQELVGMVLVVALLGPIQRLLTWGLARAAIRRLAQVAASVEDALERIADSAPEGGGAGEVRELLSELGVDRHLLYLRGPRGLFGLEIASQVEGPKALALSEQVRGHLGARASQVIDLDRAAFEWDHFFVQFELGRLQQQTACRYVLPFSLGNSLRGLLLVPDAALEDGLRHEEIGTEMGKLGVALLDRRSSTHRPS